MNLVVVIFFCRSVLPLNLYLHFGRSLGPFTGNLMRKHSEREAECRYWSDWKVRAEIIEAFFLYLLYSAITFNWSRMKAFSLKNTYTVGVIIIILRVTHLIWRKAQIMFEINLWFLITMMFAKMNGNDFFHRLISLIWTLVSGWIRPHAGRQRNEICWNREYCCIVGIKHHLYFLKYLFLYLFIR